MPSRETLKKSYLFHELANTSLDALAALAREVVFAPGDYIYQAGQVGESFYVVAEGKVELLISQPDGIERVTGQVSAGGHFGEVSLLTGNPRFFWRPCPHPCPSPRL